MLKKKSFKKSVIFNSSVFSKITSFYYSHYVAICSAIIQKPYNANCYSAKQQTAKFSKLQK